MTTTIFDKTRKIIGWGYSYIVSLPHRWLDENKLEPGDKVVFSMDENNDLILRGVKVENKKTTKEPRAEVTKTDSDVQEMDVLEAEPTRRFWRRGRE